MGGFQSSRRRRLGCNFRVGSRPEREMIIAGTRAHGRAVTNAAIRTIQAQGAAILSDHRRVQRSLATISVPWATKASSNAQASEFCDASIAATTNTPRSADDRRSRSNSVSRGVASRTCRQIMHGRLVTASRGKYGTIFNAQAHTLV